MEVYAIPNYECNLSCPHCDIRDMKCDWCKEKFISVLENLPSDAHVTLFGGEPTLFPDRLEACWKTGKITSISTNLVHVSDSAWKVLLDKSISIATSWNFVRFNNKFPLSAWLSNLDALAAAKRKCMVLVTLTDDLIQDRNQNAVIEAFDCIDSTNACSKLLFEHLVSDDADENFYERCDEWLCCIHNKWRWHFSNGIEEKLIHGWKFMCNDTWTLHPNGDMELGCPHGKKKSFCMKCMKCSHSSSCKPCALQKFCTRPNKLAKLLNIVD